MTADRYYAIDVASVATGIKVATIEKWINEHLIEPLVTNGIHYVTVEQIQAAAVTAKRHGYTRLAQSLTIKET